MAEKIWVYVLGGGEKTQSCPTKSKGCGCMLAGTFFFVVHLVLDA